MTKPYIPNNPHCHGPDHHQEATKVRIPTQVATQPSHSTQSRIWRKVTSSSEWPALVVVPGGQFVLRVILEVHQVAVHIVGVAHPGHWR